MYFSFDVQYELESKSVPVFGNLLDSLPIGVGIFGSVTRKIFKILIGVPTSSSHLRMEDDSEFGIKLFVLVSKSDPALVSHIRKRLDGVSVAGIAVNPTSSMVRILINL